MCSTYLHLLMLNISTTVMPPQKTLIGLTQHCKPHLHTSAENLGLCPEETTLWLPLVFPLIVASVLCSKIRSQVSFSVFLYMCTAGPQGWHPPHANWKRNPTGQQHMVNQTPEDVLDWGHTLVRTTKNK